MLTTLWIVHQGATPSPSNTCVDVPRIPVTSRYCSVWRSRHTALSWGSSRLLPSWAVQALSARRSTYRRDRGRVRRARCGGVVAFHGKRGGADSRQGRGDGVGAADCHHSVDSSSRATSRCVHGAHSSAVAELFVPRCRHLG